MDDLYREQILDLYKHPHHQTRIGALSPGQRAIPFRAHNAGCGDQFDGRLIVEGQKVVNVEWNGEGCAISTASMSVVSDWVVGKSLDELKELGEPVILELLGLESITPGREKCLLLPLHLTSVKKNIDEY